MKVRDECGSVLYECFNIGHVKLCSSLQKDNIIWVCEESWKASRAYVEGRLEESERLMFPSGLDGKLDISELLWEILMDRVLAQRKCYTNNVAVQIVKTGSNTEKADLAIALGFDCLGNLTKEL